MPNFQNLQSRYGEVVAQSILLDIERHLQLNSAALAAVDPEIRFQKAISMMEHAPSEARAA